MGQRMPDIPIEFGDDCGACFPAGKTPKFSYIRFSEVDHCEIIGPPASKVPPNDRLFKCTQDPGIPCVWGYNQAGWQIDYRTFFPATGGSFLDLFDDNGQLYFRSLRAACQPEGTVYHNDILNCAGADYGFGGIAVVTWTPQATALLAAMNIEKSNDLFMELFPKPDGDLVYKFTRLRDSTNIKFLFTP